MKKVFHKAPIFPYALALLSGNIIALYGLTLAPALLIALTAYRNLWRQLALLAILGFCHTSFVKPPPLASPLEGEGIFHPIALRKTKSFFGQSTYYEGVLTEFKTEELTLSRLPCRLVFPRRGAQGAPRADGNFRVAGLLTQKDRASFFFKVKTWQKIESSFSSAAFRADLKQKMRRIIQRKFPDQRVFSLLSAVATGELEEKQLSCDFQRLGLSHILAVSGFHFALLSLFLQALLSRLISKRTTSLIMLILMGLFFLYMGFVASITRAWLSLSIPLLGHLFSRESSGLNSFALSLIALLTINPLVTTQLGFQLSYMATFGILTLSSPTESLLTYLLPKRSRVQALSLSFWDKHLYCLAGKIRSACALTLAVHLTTAPLILATFGQIPYLSLIYNLFFPFAIALCLISFLLSFLPIVNLILTPLTLWLTRLTLMVISYPPRSWDFYLTVPSIPAWTWGLYFSLLFQILTKMEKSQRMVLLSGDRSSVGRVLDCGSSRRGFNPRRSPIFFPR